MKNLTVMKVKKTLAFFGILILIFCTIFGVAVYGATTVKLSLPSVDAYSSYEYQIPLDKIGLSGGEYTFKQPVYKEDGYKPGLWPAGLSVDENGKITGTPSASSAFRNMCILAVSKTDPSNKTLIKCSITIKPRKVNIVVTGGTFLYTGEEHTATAVVTDATTGEVIEDAIPTIQYGSDTTLTSVKEVGVYTLKITAPRGCSVQSQTGDSSITINALPSPEVIVDSKEFPYDGEEHFIEADDIHISGDYEGDYTIEYKRSYEADYAYTTEKPRDTGRYIVRVQTTNRNYHTATGYGSIRIYADEVDFTITNNSVVYNSSEQEPTVTPSKEKVGFSLRYIDADGNTLEGKPINVGTYTIEIILDDPNANSVGTISDRTFTITPVSVLFTAATTSWTFEPDTPRTLDITTEPAIDSRLYTVSYKKQGSEDATAAMTDAGIYDVEITFNNTTNYVKAEGSVNQAEIVQKVVNFTVSPAEYEYNDGERFFPTVTADTTDNIGQVITKYKNSLGKEQINVHEADTHEVSVVLVNNNYTVGTVEPNIVTVNPKTIKFTAEREVFDYTGAEQVPVITANPAIDRSLYTVTYTKQGGDGTESSAITAPGIYDVHINVVPSDYSGKANYVQTEDSVKTVEVIAQTVDNVHISAGEHIYSGEAQFASAEPANTVTLTYKQGDEIVEPINAGTYDIVATPNEGYVLGEVTGDTQLVIAPKPIGFTAERSLFRYDENTEEYDPVVTPTESLGDITYDVAYIKQGGTLLNKITEEGKYDVKVTINSDNYVPKLPMPIITVTSSSAIDITITGGPYIYNGQVQTPLIEPAEAVDVVYKNASTNTVVDNPIDAGEYIIEVSAKNGFTLGEITGDTHFVIKPAELAFNVTPSAFLYNDTEHTPTVTANNLPDEITYSAQYKDTNNNLSDKVKDAGEYSVVVELSSETISSDLLNNNYSVKVNPEKVYVVNVNEEVTVTGGSFTYDGEPHYAEVTPAGGVSVTYTKDGVEVTDPTEAGDYTITVTPIIDGYNPIVTGDTILTINKQDITFTVSETTHEYDGQPHRVTVTPSSDKITEDMYSISYTKDDTTVIDPIAAGNYTFTVEKTNNWNENYVLIPCTGMLTIRNYTLIYGNSPAAMIFKDEAHDDEWKQAAADYFKKYHKFDEEHCPSGCISDVEYNTVYEIDFDSDVNTVIVKDINDFIEPGIQKDGQAIMDYTEVREKINNDDNFYKITYTVGTDDEQEEMLRYVIVIGKTGDTNGDGNVNAIDANYLNANGGWTADNSRDIISITDARVWDVNHNNLIDADDVLAIRNRFKQKIVPYYPWIIKQ